MYLLSKHWGRRGSWNSAMLSRMASLTGIHFNNSATVLGKVISQSYNLFKIPFSRILFDCPSVPQSTFPWLTLKTKHLNLDTIGSQWEKKKRLQYCYLGFPWHRNSQHNVNLTRKHSRFLVGTDSVMKYKEYMF